jgi:hypothetical protein
MGSSTCCLLFDAEDEKNQYFMARILSPTFLGGNDYISFFRNDFKTLIVSIDKKISYFFIFISFFLFFIYIEGKYNTK